MKIFDRLFRNKKLKRAVENVEERLNQGRSELSIALVDRNQAIGLSLPNNQPTHFFLAASKIASRHVDEEQQFQLHNLNREAFESIFCLHANLWPEDGTRELAQDLFPGCGTTIRTARDEVQLLADDVWKQAFGEEDLHDQAMDEEKQWYEATKLFELSPERDLIGFLSELGPEYLHLMITDGNSLLDKSEYFWIAKQPNLDKLTAQFIHVALGSTAYKLSKEEAEIFADLNQRLEADTYPSHGYRVRGGMDDMLSRSVENYRQKDRAGRFALSNEQLDALCASSGAWSGPIICGWISGWETIHSCDLKTWRQA
ncbi:hypothetical protein [Aliiroseovarius sp. S253]|uniref:hypothetical protein n=1 Tax=Aliiroseovarius sp. S253 TaxID=3415133 RepID=UPI003C7BC97C